MSPKRCVLLVACRSMIGMASVTAVSVALAACGPKPPLSNTQAGITGQQVPSSAPAVASPVTGGSMATAPMPPLHVELGRSGEIKVGGAPLGSPAELRPHLERARAAGQPVTIQASAGTPQALLNEVVAEARRAGADRIDLAFSNTSTAAAPAGTVSPPAPSASSTALAPGKAGSLPEVLVRTVGMHIGGGPNDDATKAFFRKPLEERFEEFRRCYPLVDDPAKGGTFGADLTVGRQGGKPDVGQPRSTLGGARFRDCMLAAFSRVTFPKPANGATTVSCSLRFNLGSR